MKKKIIDIFKTCYNIFKAKKFMMTMQIPRIVYMCLEDNASGVQVGDIKQVIV